MLFKIYRYLLKKQKLNYYIKYKLFKLIHYTKYLKYWKKNLKPKHIENLKKNKYDYFNYKNRYKYRLLKLYLTSFYKYKLNLLKIINAVRFLDHKKQFFKYNFVKINKKFKSLYFSKFQFKKQFNMLSYLLYFFIRNSQVKSKKYKRLIEYYSSYKYFKSKQQFRKRYIKSHFLPRYKFKGKAFSYLIIKNAIYLQFLIKLIKLFQYLKVKTSNKIILFKYQYLIKFIINKWYNFIKNNKILFHLCIYKKLKEKKQIKLKKLKKIHYIFSNYLRKIIKHYLFKNIHFKFYNRNLFITITNYKGQIQFKFSIGLIGYKKNKKKTYYAAQELIFHSIKYIFKFDILQKYQDYLMTNFYSSKYFNFYWNLVKLKIQNLPTALSAISRTPIQNSLKYYKGDFLTTMLHRVFKRLFIKIILKGTKYRMKGLINKFFKALYKYKKEHNYHLPLILFFPLNNKPHNGCKYAKKKRKKKRRKAKRIKLKLQNKLLLKKLKFKNSKVFNYRRRRVKSKNPLYAVKYRVSPKYYYQFLRNKSTFRQYNLKKTIPDLKITNNLYNIKPLNSYLEYKMKRRFRSRYKFKRKKINYYDNESTQFYYSKKYRR